MGAARPDLFSSVALERWRRGAGPAFGPLAVEFTLVVTSTVAVDRAIQAGHRYFYRHGGDLHAPGEHYASGHSIAATAGRPITAFEVCGVSPNPHLGARGGRVRSAARGRVQVSLYDLQGREVAVLARGTARLPARRTEASRNGELEGGPAHAGMRTFVAVPARPGITGTRRVVLAR